jgi:hypothetical protein
MSIAAMVAVDADAQTVFELAVRVEKGAARAVDHGRLEALPASRS